MCKFETRIFNICFNCQSFEGACAHTNLFVFSKVILMIFFLVKEKRSKPVKNNTAFKSVLASVNQTINLKRLLLKSIDVDIASEK